MPQNMSVPSISEQFKLAFSRDPFKVAVKSGSRTKTFQELDLSSAQLGMYLFERLGETAAPLAIFLQDPIDIVVAILAAMRSGYSYSVLSVKNPSARLGAILTDLDAHLLLTGPELQAAAGLAAPADCLIANISDIPEQTDRNFYRQAPANDSVGIYYTSGSTGEPKGVMRLHTTIVARILTEIGLENFAAEDTHCLTSSFSASASLNFFSAFFSGATFVNYEIDKQGLSELKHVLLDEKVTVFRCSVEPLRHFLASLSAEDFFPDLRKVFPSGDALFRQDVEGLRKHMPKGAVIVDTLSSSEIGIITRNVIRHDTPLEPGKIPAGTPSINKEVFLLDEEGNEVPPGEIGEIVVRSDQPFHGYWRRPELTDEKFIPDPADASQKLFCSGDLGRFRPDGQLEHMGRKDFRVKIRGFSVDLSAIENVLMSFSGVQRAVAVAAVDPAGQKRLVAYVLPAKGVQVTVKKLRDIVSENLPSYMIPALIMIVPELPLGVTQKVDRAALPVPHWDESMPSVPFTPPGDAIEVKLSAVWKKTLRIQQVGINDDFFELGGDSLMAMQLLLAMEQEFAEKVPFAVISKASTIRQQAEILRNETLAEYASLLIPIRTNGDKKPIYCIGGKGGLPIRFNNLLKYMERDQPVYFFRSRGFGVGESVEFTIEGIAADYLREIKQIQPSGPYYFIGESSGGLVAYEMSQQLLELGEEVAFLGMLDTYIPQLVGGKDPTPAEWFVLMKKHFQTLSGGGSGGFRMYMKYYLELWKFKSYQFRIKLNEKRNRLRFGEMPDVFSRVEDANATAIQAYDPKPYPGSVVIFRALRQARFDGQNLDNGWGYVGVEKLVVHSVDCYHGNILFEPFVRQVAEKLRQYLNNDPGPLS